VHVISPRIKHAYGTSFFASTGFYKPLPAQHGVAAESPSTVEDWLKAWLDRGTSRAGLAVKKLSARSAETLQRNDFPPLTRLERDGVDLYGHDGEVLDSGNVCERESVPEYQIGVLDVVLASDPVGNASSSASRLVRVLPGAEELSVAVRRDPDMVLGERGARGDVRVGSGETHLGRVRHELVRDGGHGYRVDHVGVGLGSARLTPVALTILKLLLASGLASAKPDTVMGVDFTRKPMP
jgi:hypothetical protein